MSNFESYTAQSDVPLGYQQIATLTSSTALTVPEGAKRAIIQAETQNVRWRDDGTAPTASVGMLIASGASISYVGDLKTFRVIEATASAKLNVSYYA
jgi:hypothetical protein